jgi:septal ring factor EnvC (AmiA/AmiB activator)
VQIRLRRERARRCLLAFAILAVLAAIRCGFLYTGDPRYARGRARPRRRPVAGREVPFRGRGTLPWPVQGRVVRGFGNIVDPKYKTVTKNSGIDIETTRGSPVKAVEEGKVSFADIFMGYGRMIILDHGERSHSIYSRLSELRAKVGATVAKGETIGFSGDTLHFEFRVSGRSVDPLEYLMPR